MTKPMTLNVRVSGALEQFVVSNVGADGAYENVSEYVRDLIRRDKERREAEAFARLKSELQKAFAAPDESFKAWDVETVIRRGKSARSK